MQDNCFLDFIDPELYSHSTKMSQGRNDDEKSLQKFTDAIVDKINEGTQKTRSLFSSACIYKVPEGLHKLNKSAYTPRVIAIGPLHQKDEHLQESMQRVKWYYTHKLLNRLTKGIIEDENKKQDILYEVLKQCARKMKEKTCVDKAKKYYAAEVTVDDEKMSEMMLVDGCFILELIYAYSDKKSEEPGEMTTIGVDSGINLKASSSVQKPIDGGEDGSKSSSGSEHPWADPVIDNILTANMIKQDLILLENQIPFFVLEELFKLIVDKIPEENKLPLTEYVLEYFDNIWRPNVETRSTKTKTCCCLPDEWVVFVYEENEKEERESRKANDYYHILHFLHEDYHYHRVKTKRKDSTTFSEFKVSAADLHNAGVEFLNDPFGVYVRGTKGISWRFSGIRFHIPSLVIHERTEVFLLNLIALEQCCPNIPRHFTSYAKVMSMLINTEKDVQVLKDAGIIHNYLGTDKDVHDLFDKLCKGVTVPGDLYLDAWQEAIEYYNGRNCLPMTMRYWRRLIFTSTWGVLAFALGIITSFITVAQFVRDFRK